MTLMNRYPDNAGVLTREGLLLLLRTISWTESHPRVLCKQLNYLLIVEIFLKDIDCKMSMHRKLILRVSTFCSYFVS